MSPSERSAWIRLAAIVVVFVPYFAYVLRLFRLDDAIARPLCIAFVVAAVAHGLVNGIAQIAATAVFGRETGDERDRAIDALSLRVAYFTLISLVLGALSTLASLGMLEMPAADGRIVVPGFGVTSHFVFFCIVVAEALRHVTQVVLQRRAAWA